jgi:hypothetical protein
VSTVAILPSLDEPQTIAAVTTAIDAALDDDHAVIVHADASDTPATARRFAATATRAAKIGLTRLPVGKGAQILAAATVAAAREAEVVLIADTDTRNADPGLYRALLDRVRAGAGMAIADYPRYWDEANLTNHLARPLIAATTGHDIPQPMAGDLAVTGDHLAGLARGLPDLDPHLRRGVHGYGIDAYLLLTVAAAGPVTSIRHTRPKEHAASFPHLARIYHDAVPVLLHLTAAWAPPTPPRVGQATYIVADRWLAPERLSERLAALDEFTTGHRAYDGSPWPQALAHAWHAVATGTSSHDAAHRLWPHYLHRVRTWLTDARNLGDTGRGAILADAHHRLPTTLISIGAPR